MSSMRLNADRCLDPKGCSRVSGARKNDTAALSDSRRCIRYDSASTPNINLQTRSTLRSSIPPVAPNVLTTDWTAFRRPIVRRERINASLCGIAARTAIVPRAAMTLDPAGSYSQTLRWNSCPLRSRKIAGTAVLPVVRDSFPVRRRRPRPRVHRQFLRRATPGVQFPPTIAIRR